VKCGFGKDFRERRKAPPRERELGKHIGGLQKEEENSREKRKKSTCNNVGGKIAEDVNVGLGG